MTMKIILAFLAVLLGVAGYYYLMSSQDSNHGFFEIDESTGEKIGVLAYGYIVTLFGVLCGGAYRTLTVMKDRQEEISSISWLMKKIFLSVELWLGLFGSPLAFALIAQSLDIENLASVTVIGIENGFCCTIIVSTFMKEKAEPKHA